MKKLLLPDPEYFQSEDIEIVPLIKFYDWVIRNSSPALDVLSTDGEITDLLKHIDISKIIITFYEPKTLNTSRSCLNTATASIAYW